jgi:putative transposase
MLCLECDSAAVTERHERTTQDYRRFRCWECGKRFNERSAGVLNRTQYPSDVIALVVLWRLRYGLTLRDLAGDVSHPRYRVQLRGRPGMGGEAHADSC